MKPLSERTAHFTDSVIRRMTRIANRYGAVNLSQGFPDFAPPREITDRLAEVARTGPHQYAAAMRRVKYDDAESRWLPSMKAEPAYAQCCCGSRSSIPPARAAE